MKKKTVEIIPGLGLDKERIEALVVEKVVGLFSNVTGDIKAKYYKMIEASINAEVSRIGGEAVGPLVKDLVEGAILQETTKWGDKVGLHLTFKEYLVKRADTYMREEVNYEGKGRAEVGGYDFKPVGQRLALMIDKHIHYEISSSVKKSLEGLNDTLGGALAATVKLKLSEALAALQVTVKTK